MAERVRFSYLSLSPLTLVMVRQPSVGSLGAPGAEVVVIDHQLIPVASLTPPPARGGRFQRECPADLPENAQILTWRRGGRPMALPLA